MTTQQKRKFTVERLIPFSYRNDQRINYRAFFPAPMFGEHIEITDGTTTVIGKVGYRITGDPECIEVSVLPDQVERASGTIHGVRAEDWFDG